MPIDPPYVDNIIADIRRRVSAGELKPGDKLPSTTALAAEYDVSRNTVRDAVNRLKATGELVGHQGLGVMVPGARRA